MLKGFRDFILRGNVMDLAVAVIIGAAFTAVVYFFLVVPTQYLLRRFNPPKAEPPSTRACPQCLGEIPLAATRCKYCAQPVPAIVL